MDLNKQISATIFSKEHYDKVFAEIENLPDTLSPTEINSEIHKRLELTLIIGRQIDKEILESLNLYRLRIPKLNEDFNPEAITSYYYPPDVKKISRYRANIAEQQVFYAAADEATPFFEMSSDIKIGETIAYIGIWGLRNISEPAFIRNLFLGIPEDDENNFASIMAKGLRDSISNSLSRIPEVHRENFIYAQKRYADLFTVKGPQFYHLSSSIAYSTFVEALKQKADIPILTYPSVAKDKSAVNFAIRKDYADNHLYLKEVFKLKVVEFDDDKIKYDILARGIVEKEKVKWLLPHLDMQYTDNVFISPDGNPQNMHAINSDSVIISENEEVKINIHDIVKQLNLCETDLWKLLPKIDMKLEAKKELTGLLPIPIKSDLYLKYDGIEQKKINYLMMPAKIICSFN